MGTGRMEAFSDGVIAIIITIMVLELKVPHGTDLLRLLPRYRKHDPRSCAVDLDDWADSRCVERESASP